MSYIVCKGETVHDGLAHTKEADSGSFKPEASVSSPVLKKEIKMSDNFYQNPMAGGGITTGGALGAGALGYILGNGGLGGIGGGNRDVATTAQLTALGAQIQADQTAASINDVKAAVANSAAGIEASIGASTVANVSATNGVKDAVNHNAAHVNLALCGLGHNMQAGFASVNQSILMQGAASRELALQQALDAERARATELRIALSEQKNQAGHTATQVLLNQVINQGNP